jgi:hypothetical protein
VSGRSLLPRASAAAALVAALALAPVTPAQATPTPPRCDSRPDPQAAAERSPMVFLATVSGTRVQNRGSGEDRERVREVTVDLDRIYKGDPGESPVTLVSPAATTGLPDIPADEQWVFFASREDARLAADGCNGSRRATAAVIGQVEDALGPGRAYVETPEDPDPLAYTELDTQAPPELGRLLAPGAAAVLVGLLGLVVTRRRPHH